MVRVLVFRSGDLGAALDKVNVLCSEARHFSLRVPLSTHVYKWILAHCMLQVTL